MRVAVVGAGHISRFHLQALQRVPAAQVVGIADVSLDRAQQVASQFGIPEAVRSLDELLLLKPDAVHLVTPPATHASLAIQALQAGCHVFVEKPLATSVEECLAIAEAACQSGKIACPNHSNLRDYFFHRAIRLIERGAVGEVISATYLRSSDYPPYAGGPLPPQYREGGYPFRDVGVHALYMLQAVLGEIQDVQYHFDSRGGDPNLRFDEWSAIVQCRRGLGQIQMSWNVQPLQSRFLVQGTKGVLDADLFSMYVTTRRKRPLPRSINRMVDAVSEAMQVLAQVPWNLLQAVRGKIRRYHGVQETIIAFYESLAANAPPPVSVGEGRLAVQWTELVASQADRAKEQTDQKYCGRLTAPILVTGATGFIGRHLVRRLVSQGQRIRILARRPPRDALLCSPNIETVLGDLGDPEAVDRAVAGVETVFHLGAAMRGSQQDFERGTIVGTKNLISSCLSHGVSKVVYVSSLSVLHATASGDATKVTESWPLEAHPERRGIYTLTKLRAEELVTQAVREQGFPAVILRPGRVVGPGSPLMTGEVAWRVAGRWMVIGNGRQPLPLVEVEDVVDAVVEVIDHPVFDGSILHVVDPEVVTQNDVLRVCQEEGGTSGAVIYLPKWIMFGMSVACVGLAAILRRSPPLSPYRLRSFLRGLQFDCSAAKHAIGWEPRVGIRQGMIRAVQGRLERDEETEERMGNSSSSTPSCEPSLAGLNRDE